MPSTGTVRRPRSPAAASEAFGTMTGSSWRPSTRRQRRDIVGAPGSAREGQGPAVAKRVKSEIWLLANPYGTACAVPAAPGRASQPRTRGVSCARWFSSCASIERRARKEPIYLLCRGQTVLALGCIRCATTLKGELRRYSRLVSARPRSPCKDIGRTSLRSGVVTAARFSPEKRVQMLVSVSPVDSPAPLQSWEP